MIWVKTPLIVEGGGGGGGEGERGGEISERSRSKKGVSNQDLI
jgi:hypothetical protein